MYLYADCGATKADWLLLDGENQVIDRMETPGANPQLHSVAQITNAFTPLKAWAPKVKELTFFGAGCSTLAMEKKMEEALGQILPKAKMAVYHDVEGAAKAVYRGRPVLACILGTGSNACVYDGSTLQHGYTSLGYLLGDEGSGNYFGKQLLRDYFYQRLPRKLKVSLEFFTRKTGREILTPLYTSEKPNTYLASFMFFLGEHRKESYVQDLLHQGFQLFLDTQVSAFQEHQYKEMGFCGSVAWHFHEELAYVLEKNNKALGCIVKRPLDSFIQPSN